MDHKMLQTFVPAFMIVFVGVFSIWTYIRKRKRIKLLPGDTNTVANKMRLMKLVFEILLMISFVVAMVYAYFPEYYYLTGPIAQLDQPMINVMGILVLKISLFWVVIAQFQIEKIITLINSGMDPLRFNALLSHSEKMIFIGMLMMFVGFFIVISSMLTIVVCLIAILTFRKFIIGEAARQG